MRIWNYTNNENDTSRKWVPAHPFCSHKMTMRGNDGSQQAFVFDSTVGVSLWLVGPVDLATAQGSNI